MADNERTQRVIEQAEAAVRRYQVEQDRYLSMLEFDWQKSPRTDNGEIGTNPLGPPQALDVELWNGRRIELRDLHQYYVYQGTMCGVPPTPEGELVAALQTAQRVFPTFGQRPVMLEPVLRSATFEMEPDQSPFPYPLIWLPPVCGIAQFESDAPALDVADVYSYLVVVWFQDSYGMIDSARTLDQLRSLDWQRHAVDWTP